MASKYLELPKKGPPQVSDFGHFFVSFLVIFLCFQFFKIVIKKHFFWKCCVMRLTWSQTLYYWWVTMLRSAEMDSEAGSDLDSEKVTATSRLKIIVKILSLITCSNGSIGIGWWGEHIDNCECKRTICTWERSMLHWRYETNIRVSFFFTKKIWEKREKKSEKKVTKNGTPQNHEKGP